MVWSGNGKIRDKLKKFRKLKLHTDKDAKSKYDILKLIVSKNKSFLKRRSQKRLVNPKNYGNP